MHRGVLFECETVGRLWVRPPPGAGGHRGVKYRLKDEDQAEPHEPKSLPRAGVTSQDCIPGDLAPACLNHPPPPLLTRFQLPELSFGNLESSKLLPASGRGWALLSLGMLGTQPGLQVVPHGPDIPCLRRPLLGTLGLPGSPSDLRTTSGETGMRKKIEPICEKGSPCPRNGGQCPHSCPLLGELLVRRRLWL